MTQESLFTDGGRRSEVTAIREMLDTGGPDIPGTVFSVAAALIFFLSSLAEPVVPVQLHGRCIEAANNPILCRQVGGVYREGWREGGALCTYSHYCNKLLQNYSASCNWSCSLCMFV